MSIKLAKLFFILLIVQSFSACIPVHNVAGNSPEIQNDFMYQYSIIDALLAGVFDGDLTIGELKQKGDFGIGTFNRVDGELIMNEGVVYRVRYDSSVQVVPDADSTSLAFVKFFLPDTTLTISGTAFNYEYVQQQLLKWFNPNSMYAIRIKGKFSTMNLRAEYAAAKPYPTLTDHLKNYQVLFNLTNTEGLGAGFWLPAYMARTNVPGYHFHYISDDKKSGGHIFNFTTDEVVVEVDEIKGFAVEANTNTEFRKVNLQKDRGAELKKVE